MKILILHVYVFEFEHHSAPLPAADHLIHHSFLFKDEGSSEDTSTADTI